MPENLKFNLIRLIISGILGKKIIVGVINYLAVKRFEILIFIDLVIYYLYFFSNSYILPSY